MDEQRELSIRTALERYKRTVEEHNLATLRVIVDTLASDPMSHLDPEDASEARLDILTHLHQDPQIAEITELEEALSLSLQLDGVSHEPVVSRQAWFAAIIAELKPIPFPPPEFEYLCTLTNYVQAPGLNWWQTIRQFDLLSANLNNPARRVLIKARGLEKDRFLDHLFKLDFKAAVIIGDDHEHSGGSWALYCLRDGHWAWRYSVVKGGDWASEVFDRLEDYLDFYSTFDAPTEDEVRQEVEQS